MSCLLVLTRNYPPDTGALAFRLRHAVKVLAEDFDAVTVIAAQPNRYGDAERAPSLERHGNVTVRRVWGGRGLKARGGKVGRGLSELGGALWMTGAALRHARGADVGLVSSPPLFYLLPGFLLRRLCGLPFVADVRDLWLDWVEETGVIQSAWGLRLLRRFERRVLAGASRVTVATESFKREITSRYDVEASDATVIYNGLDETVRPREGSSQDSDATTRVLYAGNMGPSQNLAALLPGLVQSTRRWPDLEVTLVGDGAQWERLRAASEGVARFRVLERVDRDTLSRMYAGADAFLLHLARLDVYGHTVPSKIFEYVAYRKPLLCGVAGEARALCARHTDCYPFASDDAAAFSAAVDRLMSNAAPDNEGTPRADQHELTRAARAPRWRRVFASLLPDEP